MSTTFTEQVNPRNGRYAGDIDAIELQGISREGIMEQPEMVESEYNNIPETIEPSQKNQRSVFEPFQELYK